MKYLIIIFFLTGVALMSYGQNKMVDSLILWIVSHPKIDSQYIQTLHRISYRLSEKDVKKSFAYYEKVSSLSDSMNFTFGKSLAEINLGVLLTNAGNFEASNNAYFKAIDKADECGALRLKAVSLNNIGDNYKRLKNYAKCREYINEAIPVNLQLKAWRGVAINYELLHECDFEEMLYLEAKNILLKGLPFAEKANESYIYSQYYLGFGKLAAIGNNTIEAISYFEKAMLEAKKENDLGNISKAYLAKSQYLKNLSYKNKLILLDSALDDASKTGYLEGIASSAQQLSLVYNKMKNKDSSLFFYGIYRSVSDSLFSENNKRNVIIKESEWMLRRKEIENQHLKDIGLLQTKEISLKNKLLFAFFTALLLLIIIALFSYKYIQSKKKHAELILNQKITETEMKALRSQMNPHFIFNSLNSINEFIQLNNTDDASEYLVKFSKLMRLTLKNSLYSEVSLETDLKALYLYMELESARMGHKFNFKIKTSEILDEENTLIPPLLLQPFVENAIWHGIANKEGSGKITVSITRDDDNLCCIVEDDGIGRQKAAQLKSELYNESQESFGMKLTADRINIINGNKRSGAGIEITDLYDEFKKPAGTKAEIKIPLNIKF